MLSRARGPITFDFSRQNIQIPTNPTLNAPAIVIGIAYNTTHYGPNPIGQGAPCFSTSQGCPYDSLNVSTDGEVYYPTGSASGVFDSNGDFFRYVLTANACNASITPGVFEDDTVANTESCWTGFHPELVIQATCGNGHNPACSRALTDSDVDHHDND